MTTLLTISQEVLGQGTGYPIITLSVSSSLLPKVRLKLERHGVGSWL